MRWWERARDSCFHCFADKTALCTKTLWRTVTLPPLIHSIVCAEVTNQSTQTASCLQLHVYALCIQYMNGHEYEFYLQNGAQRFTWRFLLGLCRIIWVSLLFSGPVGLTCICYLCSPCPLLFGYQFHLYQSLLVVFLHSCIWVLFLFSVQVKPAHFSLPRAWCRLRQDHFTNLHSHSVMQGVHTEHPPSITLIVWAL